MAFPASLQKYSSPSLWIQQLWPRLKKIPQGKRIFSKLVGKFIPYTGSISPLVDCVEQGMAIVLMDDRPALRNHLDSIHAIALANLGEFTTGLSVISQLPSEHKAILVRCEVDYLAKARGRLVSSCFSQLPTHIKPDSNFVAVADIKNEKGEMVARISATWRLR